MAQVTLYTLKTGKIKRKVFTDDKGTVAKERFKAPYEFVPSPSELAANIDRLVATGTVDSESTQAKEALLNTNQANHPRTFQGTNVVRTAKPTVQTTLQPKQHQDIRKLEMQPAIDYINGVDTESELDRLLLQESQNKPRVRKSVLVAVEDRRAALQVSSVSAIKQTFDKTMDETLDVGDGE